MTDIIDEELSEQSLPEEEEEIAVVDSGSYYVSDESATIATEKANEAKLWAQESERQAGLAASSASTAAEARDDAIAAKEYAEAAITDANLITVATDLSSTPSNIKTVATNISNVNSVGANISNVNAVAGNATNINAVNANKTNIDAVAGNATNINAVAGNATNINAVNNNKTNIDTVAGNSTNINTVAGDINRVKLVADDIASVHTVAVDISNVIDVADNKTNIDTVAGNISNVNTVAGISSNVSTVAGISSNITAVAGNSTNINAVAGNATNINAVNANKTNIDAVAGNKTNIDAVVDNETNINTVATNISDISAVAADLENIDNASTYAAEAEQWAIGEPTEPVGGSAKYWASQASQGQIQADWEQTDTTAKDYIKNKPNYGADLSYSSNSLQLLDQDGNSLGSAVTIQSSPDLDNKSITRNSSQELQTVGVIDQNNTSNAIKTWTGTRVQYEAILNKDATTLYTITDDTDATLSVIEALYPVGSIYITTANSCPLANIISGSTWVLVSAGMVLQGADGNHAAGTTISAGLPNITGSVLFDSNSSNQFIPTSSFSGCLYGTNTATKNNYLSTATTGGSSTERARQLNVDASRSNPIYGNSNTVQPPAFAVNIYRRTA